MEGRQYLRLLRRNWVLIAVTVVLALAASALLYTNATPRYRSALSFAVQSDPRSTDPSQVYQAELLSQARTQTYRHLVTGPAVAERLRSQLKLDVSDTRLQRDLAASAAQGSVLLSITVTDTSADVVRAITRTLVTELPAYVGGLQVYEKQQVTTLEIVALPGAAVQISPTRIRYLGLGLLAGLLIGLLLAVVREMRNRRLRDTDDIRTVVGQSPVVVDIRGRSGSRPWPDSSSALILLAPVITAASTNRRPVALVPLKPGSRAAWQMLELGRQLTKGGDSVALVDADVEGQWLSGVATSPSAEAIVDVLDGGTLNDTSTVAGRSLLHVVPANLLQNVVTSVGQEPPQRFRTTVAPEHRRRLPAVLVGSALVKVGALLREKTDLVLVATGSVLLRGRPIFLSDDSVDAVLLVERQRSTKQELRVAVDVLRDLQTPVAAVVLFGSRPPIHRR